MRLGVLLILLMEKMNETIRIEHKRKKHNHKRNIFSIVSLRNPKHRNIVVAATIADHPIAFHGWGVSGVGKRVDNKADYNFFWSFKKGRLPSSKIPLMELPEIAINYIDWKAVHPDYQFLRNPQKLIKLWKSRHPFHVIFPYKIASNSLSEAVVAPAFDPLVSSDISVPTFCLFWIEDPDLIEFMKLIKQNAPYVQIGVSSLNDSKETPPFNSKELIEYLKLKNITHFKLIVEDPLMEELDIASSHTQLAIPLVGQTPEWIVKRQGSISSEIFHKHTGFPVKVNEHARIASMKPRSAEDLNKIINLAAKRLHTRHRQLHSSRV